jgi:predicted pyridoxine 5'-phosphate oxidase superfamily flavin-nucleotide-binding protein
MITNKIKEFFEQVPVMALSTVDENGVPNVSAIASKKIIDDKTIMTIDTFHKKTLQNIKQNGNIALAMWKDSVGYQIKGKATHYTKGDVFEEGKAWILTIKPQKIVKGVIIIKVTEIYYLTPNYDLAGEKI